MLGAGLVYAYVAWRVSRRRVDAQAKVPLLAFAAWWYALSVVTLTGAMAAILASGRLLDGDLFVAMTYTNVFVIALGLACLLYYLLHLFSGRRDWWRVLAPAYYAYAVFLVYFIRSHRPGGYEVKTWNIVVAYETPLSADPLFLLVLVLLVGPQIIAALAYFLLVFQVDERTLKYRITLVSLSLVVWFGATLAVSAAGLSESDAWQLIGRSLGLAAALTVLAAYYPPRWLRRRFGIVTIDEPLPPAVRPGS